MSLPEKLVIPTKIKAAMEYAERNRGPLFHYTNNRSDILDNNQIWITRADFLEDETEMDYGRSILEEALNNYGGLHEEDKNSFINIFNGYREALKNSYIFCACESKKNKYLIDNYGSETIELGSMFVGWWWNGTSHIIPEGDGYRFHYFQDLYDLYEGYVIYDKETQLDFASKVIEAVIEYFEVKEKRLLFYIQELLVLVIALCKDEKYINESEYRIVIIKTESKTNFESERIVDGKKKVFIKSSLPGGNRELFVS